MEVSLREADREDVPSLEIVRRQAIEHGLTDEYDRSAVADRVASPEDSLPEWIDSGDHLVAVIESEVTVLAYGVFDREAGEVLGVYTAPAYEREGWGTRVLDRFVEEARKRGVGAIEARVPRNAVPFFEANGYERVGTAEADIEVAVMRRRVDPG